MDTNLQTLAEVALQSQNYPQAYSYYSQLLEKDINNLEYWKGKALAACNLFSFAEPRTTEVVALIKAAEKYQVFSESDKNTIASEILNVGRKKMNEGFQLYEKEVEKRFNALEIPAGTFYEVHKTRKLPIKSEVGSELRPVFIELFELMLFGCELYPTEENYNRLISNFNRMFEHSKNNLDYFGGLNNATELNARTQRIWKKAESQLKELNPNYQIRDNSPKPTSGCFIATAVTGDYNSYEVLVLRDFRDNKLSKSTSGEKLIDLYYKYSPPMADFISNKRLIRKIVKNFLIIPFVWIIKQR